MRLKHLDGVRGFFLVSMTLGHISFFVDSSVGVLTHHSNGFVDSAQGFVTISGLVTGLVFGKRLLRESQSEMRRKLRFRMIGVWRWHFCLLGAVITLAVTLPNNTSPLLAQLSTEPWLKGLVGAALLSGPTFVDILPMYLVFMAFTPAALRAMHRGQWTRIAAVSSVVWVIGQSQLPDLVLNATAEVTGLADKGVALGLYFNRLGWQVLYFAGLSAGFLMAQGRLSLAFLHRPVGRNLALASLFLAAVFFALPRLVAHGELGPDLNVALLSAYDRQDMTLLRIATFAAHAYLTLWVLIVGRNASSAWLRNFSQYLDAFVTWRPLVVLGQNSLQVYAWHVLLCYLIPAFAADQLNAASWFLRETAVMVASLTLFSPVVLNVLYQRYAGCSFRLIPLRRQFLERAKYD